MIPDVISTLIAIVLVCATVLDQPLLASQTRAPVRRRHSTRSAGSVANRVDYLKWPGVAVAAAGVAILILVGPDCHRHLLRLHSGWCSGAQTSPD